MIYIYQTRQKVMNIKSQTLQIRSCLETSNFSQRRSSVSHYLQQLSIRVIDQQSNAIEEQKCETNSNQISTDYQSLSKIRAKRSTQSFALRKCIKKKRRVKHVRRRKYLTMKKEKMQLENKTYQQHFQRQTDQLSQQKQQKEKQSNSSQIPYQENNEQLSYKKIDKQKEGQFLKQSQQTQRSPSVHSTKQKNHYQRERNHYVETILDPSMISSNRLTKIQQFIFKQVEEDDLLKLKLKYVRSFCNIFTPSFVLQNPQTNQQLIHAKKVSPLRFALSTSPNILSLDDVDCIGMLESDFSGNQLKFYIKLQEKEHKRKWNLISIIQNEKKFISFGKSPSFKVNLRNAKYENQVFEKSYQNQITNNVQKSKFETQFQSRKPMLNTLTKTYRLEFRGRARLSSSKNFILEQPQRLGRNSLLFGKTDKNEFNLDISHPLTPINGLAIALSRFNSKIFCN